MTAEPQPPHKIIRNCLLVGLLLICLYGGVYVSLVESGLSIRSGKARAVPRYVEHRSTQKILEVFFWPAYQVDYQVRPSMWQVEFSDEPLMMMKK